MLPPFSCRFDVRSYIFFPRQKNNISYSDERRTHHAESTHRVHDLRAGQARHQPTLRSTAGQHATGFVRRWFGENWETDLQNLRNFGSAICLAQLNEATATLYRPGAAAVSTERLVEAIHKASKAPHPAAHVPRRPRDGRQARAAHARGNRPRAGLAGPQLRRFRSEMGQSW